MSNEYVLGTGNDELERLGIQHRVWADAAVGAWKRAGIGPGSKVLDLGCGPGHATFDMVQLVTETGQVFALDESAGFVAYINEQVRHRRMPQLKAKTADALNLKPADVEGVKLDAAFCRWVLCWLKEPERALKGIHSLLKPGGRLVIHDYFNWQTMKMGPRSAAIEEMVAMAVKSFKDRDGDIDIAARLPKMLRDIGFEVAHFEVHQRVARGGGLDSTLAWILTWWRTYGPKLVKQGYLSAKVFEQAAQDMNRLESDPDTFFFGPPVFEFIAKPRL